MLKDIHKICLHAILFLFCGSIFADIRKADEKYLKQFPIKEEIPGNPSNNGLRYWSDSFMKLPYTTYPSRGNSYVSFVQFPDRIELWSNDWGIGTNNTRSVFVRKGESIETLGKGEIVIEKELIDDVFDINDKTMLAPNRGMTRTYVMHDEEVGYVLLCCVCPDYIPGSVPLLPAIFISKTGKKGDWKYLGKLQGEPEEEYIKLLNEKHRYIWSDGGTIIRTDDGRWRIYLNGYGQTMAVLECDRLDGLWKFQRDSGGDIIEFLPHFTNLHSKEGIWLNVLRISENNWHVWLTDGWVPQAIWHYHSKDGLNWKPYGKQPEITRAAFGNMAFKCMRTYYDNEKEVIYGSLSIWDTTPDGGMGWMPYISTMKD